MFFSGNSLIYLVLGLLLLVATNASFNYYKYNNIFYKMYNAKQSAYGIKVQHLTTPVDIYTLMSDYVNLDKQHNKVIEYKSLTDLKNKRLSDLNKYNDPYNYLIIIQNNLTNGKDVTSTFENGDFDTMYKTYNPNKMSVYSLKFIKTFYILVKIY